MTAIVATSDVRFDALDRFLKANFRPTKAEFLSRHGAWWHRGEENRWVVEEGGEVLAYCAVIPTRLLVGSETIDAAWWVDLVVGEPHRGRGIQTLLDQKIRSAAPLIIGFPNALAAKIHSRHGWGVRGDFEVRMLPLRPGEIAKARTKDGSRGEVIRFGANLAEPIARLSRGRIESFTPKYSAIMKNPGAEMMERVFADHHQPGSVTTVRDAVHFQWRYLDAPYRGDLVFIVSGDIAAPRAIMVLRLLEIRSFRVARILDVFGDTSDDEVFGDMCNHAVNLALSHQAIQVTAMNCDPSMRRVWKKCGFLVRSKSRFCWTTAEDKVSDSLRIGHIHLSLGDGDNDEP